MVFVGYKRMFCFGWKRQEAEALRTENSTIRMKNGYQSALSTDSTSANTFVSKFFQAKNRVNCFAKRFDRYVVVV